MERRHTVFDADWCDGICDHRKYVIVVWMDLVGNGAVNEDFAWTRGSYDTCCDARVSIRARGSVRCTGQMYRKGNRSAKGSRTTPQWHVMEEEK